MVVRRCFCGGVVVFLWWCFVVLWWCLCGGVVVFLWWCFVVLWWCFCGGVFCCGVVVFLRVLTHAARIEWSHRVPTHGAHTCCSHIECSHMRLT